ncbi:hypothetical protein WJ96_05050 [Burkholderia ubonensis]|uniref:Uncharacterized protein n=1 Tax=Burkholderia ubonensis TaxID=101571 RepID=A0AAW3MQU5_9BURK|nr:hypothetical protein WJ96_05050 [Burkholderia ubonensis]KVZ92636.1 hypothetical protein WL25_16705 [Burkholderia ubonensis]
MKLPPQARSRDAIMPSAQGAAMEGRWAAEELPAISPGAGGAPFIDAPLGDSGSGIAGTSLGRHLPNLLTIQPTRGLSSASKAPGFPQ